MKVISLASSLLTLEKRLLPHPTLEDLVCILNKCRLARNPGYAKRLYVYMHENGLETHPSLGNTLFLMLIDVGITHYAHHVFDQLVYRNERSWNTLISSYVEIGTPEHAFIIYEKMTKDQSVSPNGHTFVALLKACIELKYVEKALEIHAEVARIGILETDPFVASTLIDMYVKCGFLAKAHQTLCKLQIRNVVSWTMIIAGYVDNGHSEKALECYQQMQRDCVSPDAIAFVFALKACSSIRALNKGQEIHVEIERKGGKLGKDLLVSNALIDMYVKCGSIVFACEVFDKLPVRDVFSWTAVISGYVENGQGKEALENYQHMLEDNVCADGVTFIWVLKACGNVPDAEKGHYIHADIERRGFLENDVMIGNALIDMYAKCGLHYVVQHVFDQLPIRNVVSWNVLMEGYTESGNGSEALIRLEEMEAEGISPDNVTYICCLKACGSMKDLVKGEYLHDEIERKGFLDKDLVLGNTLIDMYVKCGSLSKAREVFDKLLIRNVVSWNALIEGYVENGHSEKALECFERMSFDGINPDDITLSCCLKACGNLGIIGKESKIHEEIVKQGLLGKNLVVANALIHMYAKCGHLAKAQEVFNGLVVRDVVSWNALITGYAEHGHGNEAIRCFDNMKKGGITPDPVTYMCALKACGNQGATARGGEIHAEIESKGLLETHLFVGSTLVDMYAKCGSLMKAQQVFNKLPIRNIVPWNALMAGYAQRGESDIVFGMFDRMLGEGPRPNPITFVVVLNACSRAGLFYKCQSYFEAMSKDYGISPAIEHQSCLIDVLCRSGQLEKAITMVKKMPSSPDLVVWHTILGACQKCGNVKFGERAFEEAMQLDDNDSAAYAMMSQIYGGR